MRALLLVALLVGCKAGGTYAKSGRSDSGEVDRGETNGRQFDFVSNKPEGDDWQIRIRGTSMWASYAHEDSEDQLGTTNLTNKESDKVWKLVDKLDLSERKKGKKDEDEGYVELRLREPSDDQADIFTVYVSRATEDDDVLALASYLRELVGKHFKEKPNF
ncbi:MAG TPA: hypothetical protein VLT45_21560 [Kofleriaceae bacterium]|nr:hypothetical protein [Kofleriaceae bacterium]